MAISKQYLKFCALLLLLFITSFFKDEFTPDYLNTDAALFLKDESPRWQTIFTYRLFWLKAIAYSSIFVLLPMSIFKSSNQHLTQVRFVFILLVSIVIIEYVLIFINYPIIDKALIPKVNRLFHSPIITLFLLAAFTVNNRLTE